MNDNLISNGSFVVIKMHDDKSTNVIKVEGKCKINKKYMETGPLVGHPFGTIFEIDRGKGGGDDCSIVQLQGVSTLDVESSFADQLNKSPGVQLGGQGEEAGGTAGNDWYADTNTAQKLKNDDIANLREQGVDNLGIMKKLVENSETWSSKTSYAQEKWLKRKSRKYLPRFRVEKCTPVTMCNVYRIKNAQRICGIRPDTLGRMMSHANIHAGGDCRALIFESCLGLVVGSAAYRMRGHGQIAALYAKNQPHLEIVHKLHMPESARSIIQPAPSNDVGPAAALVAKYGFGGGVPTNIDDNTTGALMVMKEGTDENENEYADKNGEGEGEGEGEGDDGTVRAWQKTYNTTGRQLWDRQRVRKILTSGFNSLIIASHYDPLPVLEACVRLLEPSASLAVYCEHLEPLSRCFAFLNDNNLALRLSIGDTWLREFQVLPGRTHPSMQMVTSGGYLLTGVYVGTCGENTREECGKNRASSSKKRRR